MKPLVEEGINIVKEDGFLPYHEIDALLFRIKEYLLRETRTITKNLKLRYLGPKYIIPLNEPRRPKKLNVRWFDMYHAYNRINLEPLSGSLKRKLPTPMMMTLQKQLATVY